MTRPAGCGYIAVAGPAPMRMRPVDFVIVSVSLLAVAAFSLFAYTGTGKSASVVIEASGKRWIYPLSEDRKVRVPGPLGDTVVVVRGGEAYVEDSPCRDKICIQMGRISRQGQWVACLPNRVMVSIGGGGSAAEADDVSY